MTPMFCRIGATGGCGLSSGLREVSEISADVQLPGVLEALEGLEVVTCPLGRRRVVTPSRDSWTVPIIWAGSPDAEKSAGRGVMRFFEEWEKNSGEVISEFAERMISASDLGMRFEKERGPGGVRRCLLNGDCNASDPRFSRSICRLPKAPEDPPHSVSSSAADVVDNASVVAGDGRSVVPERSGPRQADDVIPC